MRSWCRERASRGARADRRIAHVGIAGDDLAGERRAHHGNGQVVHGAATGYLKSGAELIGAAAPVSYALTIWNPAGKLIGRIRLPEVCGNVCFGGPRRNRLFMAASQSLYAVYTATQRAAPG